MQLPGRLERMAEPLHTRFAPLVAALVAALEPELDGPYAFFGHSLGTLLAFETARELRRRKRPLPIHLFTAARIAPHVPFDHIPVRRLDDDALIAVLQENYQSIPAEMLREPELLKLVLKPLRADLEVHADYVHAHEEPLPVPLTALGGAGDRLVTREGVEAWREHTTSAFSMHVLPGGHYFHQEHEEAVLRIVSSELSASRARTDTPREVPAAKVAARATPGPAEVRAWIVAEVARALGIDAERVDPRERFRTYGLDSAFATALAARLGQWLGRPLPATMLWEHPTTEALTRHLTSPPAAGVAGASSKPDAHPRAAGASEPIAVIGVGCRFPGGADSPEAFWKLLRDGIDAVTDVPRDRWDADQLFDPDPTAPGKTNTRSGGFVDGVERFDAQFFGVSPREAAQMDPQQRILLELAWEALEDARVRPDALRGTSTGVFVGAMWSDYARLDHADERRIEQHTAAGLDTSIIPARISYSLGLQGPSIAVNTACSSSLVAVHLACQSLRSGESSLALCGGVSLVLSPWSTVALTKLGALSPDGRCRAFDAGANGYVRGEGAGLVVLKPLSSAVADGDRIYGVILGSAVNNDGFSNGLTAPNPQAQEDVLRKAYANAGVPPEGVHYVEAHGTGTLLGDPIEARALAAVLGAGRAPENALRIGSVKTNIGHAEAASGIAGLIKVVLAMKHGLLPRSLHFETPNPHLPLSSLGLRVQSQSSRWPESETPPLAGVSSFGFGGTNCHVVLRGAPDGSTARIFPLAADGPAALRDRMLELLSIATGATGERSNGDDVTRLAARPASLPRAGAYRVALVARSREELAAQLRDRSSRTVETEPTPAKKPRLVCIYSGQGSQWLGMGRALMKAEPAFRAALESCDRAIAKNAGFSVLGELLAMPTASRLSQVDVVQPLLFSMQVALGALWRSWGIEPDLIVGHSMGEIAAAHLAGILDLDDAARVMCGRSRVIRDRIAGQGGMLAVSLPAEDAMHAVGGAASGLVVAAYNSPSSTLLSGLAVDAALERLVSKGIKASKIGVDYASHSALMDDVHDELQATLGAPRPLRPRDAAVRMVSTLTTTDLRGRECEASYWIVNERQPVRFMQTVEKILDEGDAIFLELSPHPVLARALESIGERSRHGAKVFASGHRDQNEHTAMLTTLARLYELGVGPSEAVQAGSSRGLHLLAISAKTPEALRAQAKRYADHLGARPDQALADVCHSAITTRARLEERVAVVASSVEQAREKLEAFAGGDTGAAMTGRADRGRETPVAFLFTGQGSQYSGMGRELYETEPVFRDALDRCAGEIDRLAVADPALGPMRPLREVMFGAPEPALLDETLYAQLALFSLEYALYQQWRSWGVRPAFLIGHSVGELVAACAGGVMSLDDGLRLVSARARLMQRLPRGGAMAALGMSEEEVRRELARLGAAVSIAAVNGPSQTVISGASMDVERVVTELDARGVEARRLPVSHAFHSELMAPMLDAYGEVASRVRWQAAEIPIVSNITGMIAGGEHARGEYWVRHVREPVMFQRGVHTLEKLGVCTYLEIGPQPALLAMLNDCLVETAGVERLPSLRRGRSDRDTALRSLARLWARGLELDPGVHGAPGRRVTLPTYPFQRARHWLGARPSPSRSTGGVRIHVVDSAARDADSAEAIWQLCRDRSSQDRIVIREGEGQPLSGRLRRFLEAAVARAAREGRAISFEPRAAHSMHAPHAPHASKSVAPLLPREAVHVPAEKSERAPFVAVLESLPPAERRAALVGALQADAAVVLGTDESQAVPPGRPLRELGFDSLMSMELRKRIASRLGRTISATVAFDHPTLDALATYLIELLVLNPPPAEVPRAAKGAKGDGDGDERARHALSGLSLGQTLDELHAELEDVTTLLGGQSGADPRAARDEG